MIPRSSFSSTLPLGSLGRFFSACLSFFTPAVKVVIKRTQNTYRITGRDFSLLVKWSPSCSIWATSVEKGERASQSLWGQIVEKNNNKRGSHPGVEIIGGNNWSLSSWGGEGGLIIITLIQKGSLWNYLVFVFSNMEIKLTWEHMLLSCNLAFFSMFTVIWRWRHG